MGVNNSYYDNLIPKLRNNFSSCIPCNTELWPNKNSISIIIPITKRNIEYKLEVEFYLKPNLNEKNIPFIEKIIRICYKCAQRKVEKTDRELESYVEKLGRYFSNLILILTMSLKDE